jgi:DNA-binding GntR family transcriptional regulator
VIDRNGPIPLYQQVAAELAGRIERGELDPPGRIPSEQEIRTEFNVSRGTARDATAMLRDNGLVFTVGQRGTYVVEPPSEPDTGGASDSEDTTT